MVSPKLSPVSPFFSSPGPSAAGRNQWPRGPDVERGSSPSPSSRWREKMGGSPPSAHYSQAGGSRSVRRLVHRHMRLLLLIGVVSVTVGWYTIFGPGETAGMGNIIGGMRPPPAPPAEWGEGRLGAGEGAKKGWNDLPPGGHKVPRPGPKLPEQGNGEAIGAGPKVYAPPRIDPLQLEYEVDSEGNHRVLNDPYLAPMHPDLSLLPPPSALFPEVQLPLYLRLPTSEKFPDSRMRTIVSPTWDSPPPDTMVVMPTDPSPTSFAAQWEGPEEWDGPGEVEKVQWEGFKGARSGWETHAEMEVREERREAVRRAFAYAWQAYKDHAWGHDEVKPVSKLPSDPFNGWGASIIDTLDTLLIMGFSDEYNLCRPHVNQVNFNWVQGRDWSRGYISEPDVDGDADPEDENAPLSVWKVDRDKNIRIPVFETCIRYMGGLLAGFDLSGDELLLDRAKDLADILARSFNTESGVPAGRIDPGTDTVHRTPTVVIAEAGSMSLDLVRLSQITGNRTWFDLVQRTMDFLEQRVMPRMGTLSPLLPIFITPDGAANQPMTGSISWGGMSDSYYEYLIKTYKLLGGNKVAQQWAKLYTSSIDLARALMFSHLTLAPGVDLLAIGKYHLSQTGKTLEIEHLTSFAGAMLGLGAKLLGRDQDMKDALKFTQTCYWLSASTPTGLQPERVTFFDPNVLAHALGYENVTLTTTTKGGKEINTYSERMRGVPPGTIGRHGLDARGINRPENIESVFYMYRLTGDRKWQEKGWKMFVSWVTSAKAEGGMSSIHDVTKADWVHTDNMESFTFAETFKYHFLLQSEPDLISLDDYVLNTEAHPLLSNPAIKSGSQGLWHPPPASSSMHDLGKGGQGSDAQKFARAKLFEDINSARKARSKFKGPPGSGRMPPGGPPRGGGGRGMGGGGGRPGMRPEPPADFLAKMNGA